MEEELREICQRILDFVGDLDTSATIETECSECGSVEFKDMPTELYAMLVEMRDYLEDS